MSEKKLTKRQKRAAKLLAGGMKPTRVAKYMNMTYGALCKWRNRPRFDKYFNKLNAEFDRYIDQLQKALLNDAFKALKRLLTSHDRDSVKFAIDSLLRINRRNPDVTKVQTQVVHSGQVENIHRGNLDHKISKEKKAKIKELLEQTREFMSPN